jgi:hypothetical protein
MHNVATPCSPSFLSSEVHQAVSTVPSYSLAKNLQKNVFTTTTVSSQTEYLQVIWMNSGFLRSYAQVRFHAFPDETFFFSRKPQTNTEAYPPSYSKGSGVSFSGSSAAGA